MVVLMVVGTSTVVAAGLTIAAAEFAGCYALQAVKHMEPQVKQVFQSLPKSAFSGVYYRGGFEPKMTKREAALILGVSANWNENDWLKSPLNSTLSRSQFAIQATAVTKYYLLSLKPPPSFICLTQIDFIMYSIQYDQTLKPIFNILDTNFNKA
ncbi:hypothetical protein EI555_004853 [Monodon monoceros]|uniref:Mitochondrial import inner membrane translocase subunit TIM14 n=1 Tax=Monodon monoceros TaxID=40151 RepID=A0A4U1F739_MONMO|nr:hypothetical protein EI555_004853 [Monodon monoceros]